MATVHPDPTPRLILFLEDNEERTRQFAQAVAALGPGFSARFWADAPTMLTECGPLLPAAALISLDHDLNPRPRATVDPGTGREVAEFLARQTPVCPVIVHTTNFEGRWAMFNELRFGHWPVQLVGPLEETWIHTSWLPKARTLLGLPPVN